MKLLLDENLSRRLVPLLQQEFPGTTQVTLLGLESASDQVIWLRAKQDGYVVVTRDADFQELSLVESSGMRFSSTRKHRQHLKLTIQQRATVRAHLLLRHRGEQPSGFFALKPT